jgi:iron complex outermembrane receptor protein
MQSTRIGRDHNNACVRGIKLKKSALLFGATAVACLILNDTPSANEIPDTPTQPSDDALAAITVTAQRRSESLLDIPVSVSVLGADALKELNLDAMGELASQVPSLQVQTPTSANAPIFSLRGVSQFDYTPSQSSPIAVYTDEVYRGGAAFFSKQLYDLDRIEVLSGPQGTLYGKNATGGAINFISVKPGFDTEGYVTAGAGNYGRTETAGAFQTGLTDQIAIRFAFATDHSDGWQKNILPGGEDLGGTRDYGARLSLLYKPNDDLNVLLRVSNSQTGPGTTPTVANNITSAGVGGGLYNTFHNLYPASNPNTDYFPTFDWMHTAGNVPNRTDSAAHDASLSLDWHFAPDLELISISSYNSGFYNFSEPNSAQVPLLVVGDSEYTSGDQVAEDLRLESTFPGKSNYIAGLYVSRERQHPQNLYSYYTDIDFNGDGKINAQDCLYNLNPNPAIGGAVLYPYGCEQRSDFRQQHKTAAAYADGTIAITDALSLRGGLRLTRDEFEVTEYSAYTSGNDGQPLFNTIPGNPDNIFAASAPIEHTWNKPTGRLGIDYQLTQGQLLYATLSRGFRSGTVNAEAFNSPTEVTIVQPETLDAVEGGFKGEFLEHRLQATAAAFYYRYKDQQALNVNPATFLQTAINLGRSHLTGGEIQLISKPVRQLTLRLGLSYLDTRIDEANINGESVAGNQLPLAPRWTGNLSADWLVLSTDLGDVRLYGAGRYLAQMYNDAFNDPLTRDGSYGVIDARVSFELRQIPLTLALWGKNLTDKEYYTYRVDVSTFGFTYNHVGDPRTFGAQATYKFH